MNSETTALALPVPATLAERTPEIVYSNEQIQLIADVYAGGATENELKLYLEVSKMRGLNIMAGQLHFVARGQGQYRKVTFQTGIDAFRLIAERTGNYCPGKAPTFQYDEHGYLISATAYVKKYIHGEWHEIEATAFYDEYVQTKYNSDEPNSMWKKMPRSQLAKCAESLAIRKTFPEDLSGLYTSDEMGQSENDFVEQHGGTVQEVEAVKAQLMQAPPVVDNDDILKRGRAKYERLRQAALRLGVKTPDGRDLPPLPEDYSDLAKLVGYVKAIEADVKAAQAKAPAEAPPAAPIAQEAAPAASAASAQPFDLPVNGEHVAGPSPALAQTYQDAQQGNAGEEEKYFGDDAEVSEGQVVSTPVEAPAEAPKTGLVAPTKDGRRLELLEALTSVEIDTSEAGLPDLMARVNKWRKEKQNAKKNVQFISEMTVSEMGALIAYINSGAVESGEF